MEDQDFWRLSGIERDVFLTAYPQTTIWDFFLHAGLDDTYRHGQFRATVDLRSFNANATLQKGTLTLELKDAGEDCLICAESILYLRYKYYTYFRRHCAQCTEMER